MKFDKIMYERQGFLQNFRAQPLLFIGSALGLLVVAVWKGGLSPKRGVGREK